MERRKSQLEMNNDLINKEMKSLFTNNNRSGSNNQNIAIIDTSMVNQTILDQKQQQQSHVNFNNAIFNKNFIPLQTITSNIGHNETHSDSETPTFNSNLNNTDVYLNDDISLMPVIDDKSLLSTLKAKFEMRKFYVRFENSLNIFWKILIIFFLELYWRATCGNKSKRKIANI